MQWRILAAPPISLLDTLSAVDDAIDCNGDLADAIFQVGLASFGLGEKTTTTSGSSTDYEDTSRQWRNWHGTAKSNDISKAHSTIRQFYRDWSAEGYALEVKPLLDTILFDLEQYCTSHTKEREVQSRPQPPSLLLPGAGLGRLLFDLCLRGYNVTGNEISYHQLLASNFILNCTQHADQYPIYPFAHTFTNVVSRANQLRRHTIPDVHPGIAMSAKLDAGHSVGEMNMTAGDFVLSYSTPESEETFDGVVSVFFIDTAPNLIRYIDTVRNCLKKGGVWINIGPLLWHFDDRAPGGGGDDDDDADADTVDEAIENNITHAGVEKNKTSTTTDQGHQVYDSTQPPHDHGSHGHVQGQSRSRKRNPPSSSLREDKGIAEPGSFELSNEEVLQLVSQLGFEILHHEILGHDHDHASTALPGSASSLGSGSGLGYMQDPTSLLQNRYHCSHWVARKI